MRSENHSYFQSTAFALIIIVICTFISIAYLHYRITYIETRNEKYSLLIPPNGTVLYHPSPTSTPLPKNIFLGKYSNEELGITLTLPENSKGLETIEPDDWLKLKIESLTNKNLVMNISRSMKIWGYGGRGIFSCKDILINGKKLVIVEQNISRCKFTENKLLSYDVRILYKDENDPLAIRVYYDFIQPPSPQEFIFFDQILSTMVITK